MALDTDTGATTRNAAVDAITAILNVTAAGNLRGYDGTKPADADTALSGNTLGFTCPLNATSFAAASAGVATANAITSDTSADATITLSWHSLLTNANVRKIDGTAGVGTFNLNVNSTAVASGITVAVTSYTLTMAGSA
jgi:hypothetical protein